MLNNVFKAIVLVDLNENPSIFQYLFKYFSRVPIQHSVGLPWGPGYKNMIQL